MGSSVENLLEGTPKAGRTKESKRKRWFRRKKGKPKMKQQVSLQEKVDRPPGEASVAAQKTRSQSHDMVLDGAEGLPHGEADSERTGMDSARSTLQKRRSNTIIEKYRAIVDEQKKKAVPPIVQEKLDSLPRFVDVRVGEMSPEEFRESLFCSQLEYKLRAALQNVHTPLTSDPPGLRGNQVARPDLKCQVRE